MPLPSETSAEPESRLDEISTRWASISDPTQFVMRYSVAIERYLRRLIPNHEDALDVMQSFLLRAVQQGFPEASADRGRFRFYLKTAVRHAALMHHRQRTSERRAFESLAIALNQSGFDPAEEANQPLDFDDAWTSDWRNVLLDRVWNALAPATCLLHSTHAGYIVSTPCRWWLRVSL